MKMFICALVIFVILITGTFIYMNWLEKAVSSVNQDLSKLSNAAETGNWHLCRTEIKQFSNRWDKLYPKLEFFINHNEINNINQILFELDAQINVKNQNATIITISILQKMIHDLPSGERLTWENVLFLTQHQAKKHIVLYTG